MGHRPPGDPAPQHGAHGIDHVAGRVGPWPTTRSDRRQQRRKTGPLGIRQIGVIDIGEADVVHNRTLVAQRELQRLGRLRRHPLRPGQIGGH